MKRMKRNHKKPPWQELDQFLLQKIFSFLPLHDLLFGPPFVCHSWLSATLDTLFQNSRLDLRRVDDLNEENERLRYTHLLKLAIKNDPTEWVSIYFPREYMFGYFGTLFIAEKTPNISCVVLPSDVCVNILPIFVSLLNWKNVSGFHARIHPDVGVFVISQLIDCCSNVVELGVHGVLMEKELSSISQGFPQLQVLDLSESTICNNGLYTLLDGRLKCIKELNILHCLFLGEDGDDISKDYVKFKEFVNELLEKVSGIRSLKKFLHCLGKTCQQCKDFSSSEGDN